MAFFAVLCLGLAEIVGRQPCRIDELIERGCKDVGRTRIVYIDGHMIINYTTSTLGIAVLQLHLESIQHKITDASKDILGCLSSRGIRKGELVCSRQHTRH